MLPVMGQKQPKTLNIEVLYDCIQSTLQGIFQYPSLRNCSEGNLRPETETFKADILKYSSNITLSQYSYVHTKSAIPSACG